MCFTISEKKFLTQIIQQLFFKGLITYHTSRSISNSQATFLVDPVTNAPTTNSNSVFGQQSIYQADSFTLKWTNNALTTDFVLTTNGVLQSASNVYFAFALSNDQDMVCFNSYMSFS